MHSIFVLGKYKYQIWLKRIKRIIMSAKQVGCKISMSPASVWQTALVFPLGAISAQTSDKNKLVLTFPALSCFWVGRWYASGADWCAVVCFAPSHLEVMQEQKVVQLKTTETLAVLANLIIGPLGGSDTTVEITGLVFCTQHSWPARENTVGNWMTGQTLELCEDQHQQTVFKEATTATSS